MTHRRHLHQVAPTTLDDLAGHVPQTYIDGARAVSSAFQKAGVAHVLVGGLAVGVCGYPRPTKDIDFLVDDSAFEFHGPIVSHRPGLPVSYQGVSVDWVSLEPHDRAALEKLKPLWHDINRLIVITDEQSQDGISAPWLSRSWIINVAPNRNGVSYRNGWNHVDGFSERILDYIREIEQYDSSTESQNNGDNYLDSF